MDWNALSAVAGLLAAVAVIFSAVYLAIQIRENTRATRSQTHHLATSQLAEAAAFIAASSELSRIYRIGLANPGQLSEDEFFRFALIGISQFRRYENLFFQYRSGLVDEDFWISHSENILWYFHRPGMQLWWNEKRLTYSKGFREYLESSNPAELESPEDRRV